MNRTRDDVGVRETDVLSRRFPPPFPGNLQTFSELLPDPKSLLLKKKEKKSIFASTKTAVNGRIATVMNSNACEETTNRCQVGAVRKRQLASLIAESFECDASSSEVVALVQQVIEASSDTSVALRKLERQLHEPPKASAQPAQNEPSATPEGPAEHTDAYWLFHEDGGPSDDIDAAGSGAGAPDLRDEQPKDEPPPAPAPAPAPLVVSDTLFREAVSRRPVGRLLPSCNRGAQKFFSGTPNEVGSVPAHPPPSSAIMLDCEVLEPHASTLLARWECDICRTKNGTKLDRAYFKKVVPSARALVFRVAAPPEVLPELLCRVCDCRPTTC